MHPSGPADPWTTPAWPGVAGRFFPAATHRAAIAAIAKGLRERGAFVALTGDPGLGKTTLLNAILAGPTGMAVSVRTLRDEHGAAAPDAGRVLVLDDAHAIPLEALESLSAELRLGTLNPLLARIVFAGHPEFWSRLQRPSLAALRDRIAVRAVLFPMPYAEAAGYVEHLLQRNCGPVRMFLPEQTMHKIVVSAQGNPRRLDAGVRTALAASTSSHRQRREPPSAQGTAAPPGPAWGLRPAVEARIAWIAATAAIALAAAVVLAPGMDDRPRLQLNRSWLNRAEQPGDDRSGNVAEGTGADRAKPGEASEMTPAAELPPNADAASRASRQRMLPGEQDPGVPPQPHGASGIDGEH